MEENAITQGETTAAPPAIQEGVPLQSAIRRTESPEERMARRDREKKYRRYRCHECTATYVEEWDAANCCGPEMVYVCPSCEEVYFDAVDAESCERKHVGDSGAQLDDEMPCFVCGQFAEDLQGAVDHCLWRTLSFADRLTLRDHLRFGRHDAARAMYAGALQ